jgi:hypothetical protein
VASTFHANSAPGNYSVTAAAPGVKSPVYFSLTNSAEFLISSGFIPHLYPGATRKMDLVVTNPNPVPISIERGGVAITISTTRPGCPSSVNFTVAQGLTTRVSVPAHATRSLSELGVPRADWPSIAMVETHANQDACEGGRLDFHFRAIAAG